MSTSGSMTSPVFVATIANDKVSPLSPVCRFLPVLSSRLRVTCTNVLISIVRSEEHTYELQSHVNLVCRLLLEPLLPRSLRVPYTTLFRSDPPGRSLSRAGEDVDLGLDDIARVRGDHRERHGLAVVSCLQVPARSEQQTTFHLHERIDLDRKIGRAHV